MEIKTRGVWEFWVLMAGAVTIEVERPGNLEDVQNPTLWAFPPGCPFGWRGTGEAERAVFDFSAVPPELEHLVPARGYYRVGLSRDDCNRIRTLVGVAELTIARPTQVSALQQQAIAIELSLMGLAEVRPRPLKGNQIARARTEQALLHYASDMADKPSFEDIARTVHVSPAHLRRLFHEACGESPQAAFLRLRMQRTEELLTQTSLTLEDIAERVGLSGAPALSRAVKAHFGVTPATLRRQRRAETRLGAI